MKLRDPKDLPTADEVRALLTYCPVTGELRWRARPGQDRDTRRWNTTWAGKITGSPDAMGYRRIKILGRFYYAHRLAWLIATGEWPSWELEHVDADPRNNKWLNLRLASRGQSIRPDITE